MKLYFIEDIVHTVLCPGRTDFFSYYIYSNAIIYVELNNIVLSEKYVTLPGHR